ncbi:MAG: hypothetical protein O7B99_15765, partial [Planctomycetota bacterium]|nr:hypothetical protein [Planctomycetota bacterium]
CKKNKTIIKDVDLFAALLRAIAQHRSPSSIDVLSDNPFKAANYKTIKARVLGLGYIRDERSVEALFGMLNKIGPLQGQGVMQEFRIALMVLTGEDQGESRQLWIRWWNENKKTFEVPEKAPRLPEKVQERWDYYWGIYHKKDRGEKREDRGDDPEDDDA